MSTDLRVLLHAVVNPSSNEGYVRDQQTLSDLFKEPALAGDHSLSQPERLMASVITARELKTKWRSKATRGEEARSPGATLPILGGAGSSCESSVRRFKLTGDKIARPQLSLLVAVARIEYPRTWQNLPQLLLEPLLTCLAHLDHPSATSSSSTSTVLLNTLWTINALVKEWRTVKVAQGVAVMQAFEQVFTDPLQRVLAIWGEEERNGRGDWVLGEAGRYSFNGIGLEPKIHSLVHHTVHHAPIVQSHRLRIVSEAQSEKLLRSLTKHLRAIGKWWRVMLAIDPKGFCKVQDVTTGVGWWWGEVGGVVAGSDGSVANDVFTPEFILSAFHLLVDKLLPLTSTDLEALEDEPEEWLIGESVDEEAWAFEFRRVLIALNNSCRHIPRENKVIEPEMLKLLATTEAAPPNDLPSVLRRESVYCALGRLSRSMSTYGGVDFNALLNGMGVWIGQGQPFIKLIGESNTLDGKRYVNDTIGVVIERVGDKILPFLPTLAQAVPGLCEWLFKASLVVLTTKLVSAAKESSGDLMELVIPLIEESLQPPAKDFFEEDGLILWQTALYNAASPYQPTQATGLIRLLPGLLSMLGENMDLLPKLLGLLDSYILLDAAGITQLATLLLSAGIFQHITIALEDDKASGQILAAYLEILSRIAMVDPNGFLQMVGESARRQSKDGSKLLEEVLDALWRNFDYVGETRMRKAVAMGAGALLTTISQEDPSGPETGLLPWQDEHSTIWTEIQDTPEGKRRLVLENADPAYAVPLKSYVVQVLTQSQAVGLGPYWDKADEGTKHSLQKFLH
ncbi:hypothetical protein CI109_101260 [Kwoniella shandongensis]|uniref:Importin-7/11-like TPR repeats domain-containing protein n=1 Tax=Kwoniella shandongensis TaxID=1734106 RepID=A0AAJ8LD32_9TREE